MQALLLLANANIDLLPPVERAIVEEGQQLLELLHHLGLVRDRSDEFVVVLDLDHQRCKFQIQQQNVLFVLDGPQYLIR